MYSPKSSSRSEGGFTYTRAKDEAGRDADPRSTTIMQKLKSFGEFFELKNGGFNLPSKEAVMMRFRTNIAYYQGNYFVILLLLLIYMLVCSPFFLVAILAAMAPLWYMVYRVKGTEILIRGTIYSRRTVISYVLMAFLGLSLVLLGWSFLLGLIICIIAITAHAMLRVPNKNTRIRILSTTGIVDTIASTLDPGMEEEGAGADDNDVESGGDKSDMGRAGDNGNNHSNSYGSSNNSRSTGGIYAESYYANTASTTNVLHTVGRGGASGGVMRNNSGADSAGSSHILNNMSRYNNHPGSAPSASFEAADSYYTKVGSTASSSGLAPPTDGLQGSPSSVSSIMQSQDYSRQFAAQFRGKYGGGSVVNKVPKKAD